MTVRVVNGRGEPIPDLAPGDFRVRVGGKEVPVVAVDWVGSGDAEPALPSSNAGDEGTAPEAAAPREAGKLVVFFVQADLEPTRISGQLRIRPYTEEFLGTLRPEDRMAVISFDSHLHLRQDFTGDREEVFAAIDRGMLWGDSEMGAGSGEVALAPSFDLKKAVDAASPERALEVTAEALQALPGEKVIVFLGWGMGSFSHLGVQMKPAFAPAVRALRRARASVFVLDVTSAGHHSLEVGLEAVAAATGGTYAKTNILPGLATDFLAKAITGHYIVTIDPATVPEKGGRVDVDLRRGLKGTVLARPVTLR
jgi:VWFA-related protein